MGWPISKKCFSIIRLERRRKLTWTLDQWRNTGIYISRTYLCIRLHRKPSVRRFIPSSVGFTKIYLNLAIGFPITNLLSVWMQNKLRASLDVYHERHRTQKKILLETPNVCFQQNINWLDHWQMKRALFRLFSDAEQLKGCRLINNIFRLKSSMQDIF
jgi:hypothetical protein